MSYSIYGLSPVESWFNYYLRPNKVYVEEINKGPDINSYEWLAFIHTQSSNIATNNVVRANTQFYRAVIAKNTKTSLKQINQWTRRIATIVTGLVISWMGKSVLKKGAISLINARATNNEEEKITATGTIILGFIMLPGIILSFNALAHYFKLKKRIKTNKKMLLSLDSHETSMAKGTA